MTLVSLIYSGFSWLFFAPPVCAADGIPPCSSLQEFERGRNSRVILLIHRQESISLLGIPISRYITIEDSEQVLRAIRLTPPNVPLT